MSRTEICKTENGVDLQKRGVDQRYINPAVDVFESEESLTLVADLPGISQEQLEISVEQNVLTVSAALSNSSVEKSFYSEFIPAGYYRQFRLFDDYDVAKADAGLKNGVLSLRLPKAETAKPRKIDVKTVH
jgi:HSP20 family molecular chaperone IbpA